MRELPGAAVAMFVGRDAELARLASALPRVAFALVLGLPGVGKTALVAKFAESWPGPVLRRRVLASHAGAEILDELRRALARRTQNLVSDDERVADLTRLLDVDGALVVLEDVDRLDGTGRALLADLIQRLCRARIVATARTHVFGHGDGPERLQLVLEGLDRDAAIELWAQLDLLYGVGDDFEGAWLKARGNPFYLRRAHAGDRGADPLLTDTVASLVGDDRALAIALAIADPPLSPDAVERLMPDGRGAAALGRLIGCLVAERLGDQVTIHDLIRSAMSDGASPAELQQTHRQLAAALLGTARDPVVEVKARVRHLLASGQRAAARALVLERAAELIRLGGSGELIRCLDALMADGDVEIRLARARILGRMLDLRRAFEDLSHLGASRDTASDPVRASFAHLAMLTARFDIAERISRAALARTDLDPVLRVRHCAIWLNTRTYQGHGEEARAWITEVTRQVEDPKGRGLLAFFRAFSFWLEERDAEAEEAMRQAWVFLEHDLSVRARLLGPTFWVTVLARVGKIDEARDALAFAEATIEGFEDPLIEVSLSALRATWFESRGDFAAALAEMALTERRWAHGGLAMGVHWARLHRGEFLLRVGRVREGHQLLDDVARDATAAGLGLIARQIDRARGADPRLGVRDDRTRPTRPGEIRRDRVLAVLRAIGTGAIAVARGHLAAITGDPALDAIELALVELARAALARDDDPAASDALLTRAAELAGRAQADPELIVDLDRWLCESRTGATRTIRTIVVDRKEHAIRVGDDVVTLASRPILRRILYTLLATPGRSTTKASLAAALWSSEYHPERHDGALWTNLKRLRDLLQGSGLRVVTDSTGYSVVVEDGHQLVMTHEHA
ncbi:MAG TPA: AAA family ATPase [Kofleriaceae bacterium]|jgi:hypothetical protein|nr:AAA family ATPase [Kofleriaceae bacterium]